MDSPHADNSSSANAEKSQGDAPDAPIATAGHDEPDYLRPWELVPVFAAMSLAIFILGLVSDGCGS